MRILSQVSMHYCAATVHWAFQCCDVCVPCCAMSWPCSTMLWLLWPCTATVQWSCNDCDDHAVPYISWLCYWVCSLVNAYINLRCEAGSVMYIWLAQSALLPTLKVPQPKNIEYQHLPTFLSLSSTVNILLISSSLLPTHTVPVLGPHSTTCGMART